MRRCVYEPLTAEGAALKERWRQCVDWTLRLQDVREELNEIDRSMDIEELRRERRELESGLEALRASIRRHINDTPTLTSMERRILRLRYLCADPWDAIAMQVGREPSAAFTAHRKALNKIAVYLRFSAGMAG